MKVTIVELKTKTPQRKIRMLMNVAYLGLFPVAVLLHTQVKLFVVQVHAAVRQVPYWLHTCRLVMWDLFVGLTIGLAVLIASFLYV
jgi:hypothetical protein